MEMFGFMNFKNHPLFSSRTNEGDGTFPFTVFRRFYSSAEVSSAGSLILHLAKRFWELETVTHSVSVCNLNCILAN
jgi:hypothetical protein